MFHYDGFGEEQVAVFAVDERADGAYVSAAPAVPRRLLKHKTSHLLDEHPREPGAPELAARAVDLWSILDMHRSATEMHVPRAGRKASGLPFMAAE